MNTAVARLRAKTDRDLAVLIRREFDNTIHCNSVSSLDDSVYGDQMKIRDRWVSAGGGRSVHEKKH